MQVKNILLNFKENFSLVLELSKQNGLYGFAFYTTYDLGGFGKLLLNVDHSYKSIYDLKVAVKKEARVLIRKYFKFNKKMIDEINTKLDQLEEL